MNDNQTWSNLGEEIKDAVEDAIKSGDFRHLNNVISDAATGAINTVKGQMQGIGLGWDGTGQGTGNRSGFAKGDESSRPDLGQGGRTADGGVGQGGPKSWSGKNPNGPVQVKTAKINGGSARAYHKNKTEEWIRNREAHRFNVAPATEQAQQRKAEVVQAIKAPFKRIGRVSGTLYQVFGGVGTGVMAVLSIVFLGLALGFGGGFRVALGIFAILLVGFIGMINVGSRQKRRLKRAEKYRELSGQKHYVNLEDLSLHTNKTMKYIVKDVKKMLEDGFFPEGHLDKQESCLMLDDKIYREYLALEKQRRIQENERQALADGAGSQKKLEDAKGKGERAYSADPQLDAMIAEGQDYIRRLREMNDNIPGEVISRKLFRLENLLKEIFESLREHPEQKPQMQKFMSYYLPTTIKLVDAYEKFDSLSVQGQDIKEAKAEIEKTLDTINSAFGELLNKLFRDTAYDVTTDAQVLQTMLAREGLAGEMEKDKDKIFSGLT